jgi:hypothetical protein
MIKKLRKDKFFTKPNYLAFKLVLDNPELDPDKVIYLLRKALEMRQKEEEDDEATD